MTKYLEPSAERDMWAARYRLGVDLGEAVAEAMEKQGVNERQLAERLECSASDVSRAMGECDDLHWFADALRVLGYRVEITLQEEQP